MAPGEDVSRLEDEYDLAPPTMPRLISVKETTRERESRLTDLLGRIGGDDMASFECVSDEKELGDSLQGGLAVLLAERFHRTRGRCRAVRRGVVASAKADVSSLSEATGRCASPRQD